MAKEMIDELIKTREYKRNHTAPQERLGREIRMARLRSDWSQKSVANALDISTTYLSLIEKGKETLPSEEVLRKLSELLDLDYTSLLKLSAAASLVSDNQDVFRVIPGLSAVASKLCDLVSSDFELEAVTLHFRDASGKQPQNKRIALYRSGEEWEPSTTDPESSAGLRKRVAERIQRTESTKASDADKDADEE